MNGGGWILIITILVILLLFSLLRRRGGPSKYPETVQSILWDIKLNQVLADTFLLRQKPAAFEKINWQMNEKKIGFLTETLKVELKEIFTLVDEFNVQIIAAKKNKSDSYKSLDLTRFKELLAKTRQELEDWMITTTGSKDLPPKYPTLSSMFMGDR
jgi:hypothetical protein